MDSGCGLQKTHQGAAGGPKVSGTQRSPKLMWHQTLQFLATNFKMSSHAMRVLSRFSPLWLFVTHGLWPSRHLCLWDFPVKNTVVGSHSLLQGIFLTQGWNPRLLPLLRRRWILYCWATGEALTCGKSNRIAVCNFCSRIPLVISSRAQAFIFKPTKGSFCSSFFFFTQPQPPKTRKCSICYPPE